jgi:adenylate cyclase
LAQDSNPSGTGDKEAIVAALRVEVPTNDRVDAPPTTGVTGTLDLGDVDCEVSFVEEIIPLVAGETFRVGRSGGNDLVLKNTSVSRFHAIFSASSSGLVLSDLSSLNGTFHNGRRISTPVNLSSGDTVRIGHVKIRIDLRLGESNDDRLSNHETKSNPMMRSGKISVLVVDIAGFTTKSQALPPQDVAKMLDDWFELVAGIVYDRRGEVDKYIGDCVMALWYMDAKTDEDTSVTRAVQAAAEIVEKTRKMVADGRWPYQDEHPWDCRVAINTGDALIGTVGGKGSRDFTVLGDTVNVAFRLEKVAKQQEVPIIFGEETANDLSNSISVRSLGNVTVPGRSDAIKIYTLD